MLTKDDAYVLGPGDWVFLDNPKVLVSLLGSCIAVLLWHPKKHCGGMCHYLYAGPVSSNERVSGRNGQDAVNFLLAQIKARKHNPREYKAGIFGGVKPKLINDRQIITQIVDANIQFAHRVLSQHRITLVCQHVGFAEPYLRIKFDMATGKVFLTSDEMREVLDLS